MECDALSTLTVSNIQAEGAVELIDDRYGGDVSVDFDQST